MTKVAGRVSVRSSQDRGLWLGAVVLIMFVISLAQAGISYSMTFGALQHVLPRNASVSVPVLVAFRLGPAASAWDILGEQVPSLLCRAVALV